jgi:hypothetical protein
MSTFTPHHARRTHAIQLDGPPAAVFPLFEPLGEKRWVPSWDPKMLHPLGGDACEGAVFVALGHDDSQSIWVITHHEPTGHHVRYTRVAPGSHVAVIDIRCEATTPDSTRAQVSYDFTALSAEGNEYVDAMDDAQFRDWIQSWQTAINRYLRENPGGV